MNFLNGKSFFTRAVHAGERRWTGALRPVTTPIHPSVGYTFADSSELDVVLGGERPGFVYSTRYANPTTAAFEAAVAELEGAPAAYAFASGMAAVHAALLASGIGAGMSIVAAADVYGATYSLLDSLLRELGVKTTFIDVTDMVALQRAVDETAPRLVWVETISNPLLKVANLPEIARIAHASEALLLVDNTFCSPYLCRPMEYGADLVIHSATKFLSGHGDVMAGVVAAAEPWVDRLLAINKLVGGSLGPFEAWLALRGLKTLPLRMQRQTQNALALAKWLTGDQRIRAVHYPYLTSHPQNLLAQTLTGGQGGGGVFSFEFMTGGRAEAFAFLDALRLIQPATSLGDIYSLALYPAISSHRSLHAEARSALGIHDGLLRISAGIEAFEDIQADLAQALDAALGPDLGY